MSTSPIVPPGGQFPVPATSNTPLLAFRCAPAIRPYLPDDASSPAAIIIDTPVTNAQIEGTVPISLPADGHGAALTLAVTISHNGKTLASGHVPLNASKVELPFSLSGLKPQKTPLDLLCAATLPGSSSKAKTQKFSTSTQVSFLPSPPKGRSVTKMDLRTGALLAKPATGAKGDYETVFPIGFYTDFGGFLAKNLSALNVLKDQG